MADPNRSTGHGNVSGVPNAVPARLASPFPLHTRPGFDQIAQGMGGLMLITGAPGEGPIRVGIPVADLTAGLFCTIGILTALLERDFSGEGQCVQASSPAVLSQPPRCPRVP
jgi:crotonobetainyl-CoA:carnitine CoA-transferase CaiB-like acyl-CoA transferase